MNYCNPISLTGLDSQVTEPQKVSWSSKENAGVTNREGTHEQEKISLNIIRPFLKAEPRKSGGKLSMEKNRIPTDTPEEMEIGNQRAEE